MNIKRIFNSIFIGYVGLVISIVMNNSFIWYRVLFYITYILFTFIEVLVVKRENKFLFFGHRYIFSAAVINILLDSTILLIKFFNQGVKTELYNLLWFVFVVITPAIINLLCRKSYHKFNKQ